MVRALAASDDPVAYFREDMLANEHHQHWHLVYLADTDAQPREKERQGELFLYMHEQMLARYDTERLAAGQARVVALEPTKPLHEGYDPHWPGNGYVARLADASLVADQGTDLDARTKAFLKAVDDGTFERLAASGTGSFRATGPQPGLDLLGSTIEAHGDGDGDGDFSGYAVHNKGHMDIASIDAPAPPYGVMADTATAIRDPIFWQWHRLIDDAAFAWQDKRGPRDFAKVPDTPLP
jgi:tyrosinase